MAQRDDPLEKLAGDSPPSKPDPELCTSERVDEPKPEPTALLAESPCRSEKDCCRLVAQPQPLVGKPSDVPQWIYEKAEPLDPEPSPLVDSPKQYTDDHPPSQSKEPEPCSDPLEPQAEDGQDELDQRVQKTKLRPKRVLPQPEQEAQPIICKPELKPAEGTDQSEAFSS